MRGHIRSYQLKAGGRLWAAIIYQGKRATRNGKVVDSYRWVRGFKTRKAAQTELTNILRAVNEGTYVEPSKLTLSAYLERWLSTVKGNLGNKTFERYRELIELNVNPKLGPIPLAKLQPVQIAEFYRWLALHGNRRTKRGLSMQTVLHIHRLLSRALKQAVMWQLRALNPANSVEAPRPLRKERKAIEEDRSAFLLECSEGSPLYLPILIGLCTGMRRGEILGLRWRDVNLNESRLTVNQSLENTREGGLNFKSAKTRNSHRTISLPECLISALKDYAGKQHKVKDLWGTDYPKFDLVVPLEDGTPWVPDSFTDAYRAFTRRIGASDIRFHDLRHTHASELLRRGIPLKTVSQRLGHANATVTLNTYAHLMSGDDQRAADLLDELIPKQLKRKGAMKPK